jgi:predicted dehydrogenase
MSRPHAYRKQSRRQFVTATAASTAFAFTYLPGRVWGANERLNVACIGVGGKGRGEVRDAAAEGCNIVALCDVDERRAAGTYKEFPRARKYQDFRVMLDKQRDIDAVTVSTPDHTHAVASMLAMRMGKHVYCQKPLTHSIYEARLMAETAAQMQVATQMGNQGHASGKLRRAVELVRAGVIGPVHEVHVWTNRPIWPQGLTRPAEAQQPPGGLNWDLWLGPAPQRPYHAAYVPFKWRGWWDFGTGALGDMACHLMDMPYWALDLGYPVSLEAVSHGGTEESPPLWSIINYEFPARGEQPPVKMVWYDGNKLPPLDVTNGRGPEQLTGVSSILIGAKGKMFFDRSSADFGIRPAALLEDFQLPEETIPRVASEDAEWVAACKGGPPALSNFGHSGPFTEVVLAGNLAVRANRRVVWDGPGMKCPEMPELEPYIRREYRQGWTL